ncbi:unnamed protein product, partial [Sphacelaria rigidula]
FHLVPYSVRVSVSSLIMMLCFISVAYGRATWVQLFGVTCAALQEGVGEASFLALASLYDTPRALSAWSSGTGFAGIFGYGWVYFLTFVFGLSNRSTLVVACSLAVAWMFTFFVLLTAPRDPTAGPSGDGGGNGGAAASVGRFDGRTLSPRSLENASVGAAVAGSGLGEAEKAWEDVATLEDDGNVSTSLPVAVAKGGGDDKRMTPGERLRFTLGLWRYMLPLSLVFFAEVCMCSRVYF